MRRAVVLTAILFFCAGTMVRGDTQFTTVVIDPGHGGFDRGGIPGQRVAESKMTLDVSLRLRQVLERAGYRVIMTRDRDVFVPLGTRVATANAQHDAVFICVHFNSATRAGASGIETYFYSTESAPLAASIQSAVVRTAGTENRGVRRRGYFVLRRTTIPAVLVECGFLTNPYEATEAQNAAYRQQLAQSIAHGILARPAIATRTRYTDSSSRVDVGLQPFLDQRHVRGSGTTHHHKAKSKKKKTSKKKKKRTSTDDDNQ
ncbi:MAG: N-acetylmuramoyl-L-alanine amidase [Verrucomicrobia bacterium]|nr:N-acetylmuramoyl-L-alanine amidase [Verrucomicrobiota bacterium]